MPKMSRNTFYRMMKGGKNTKFKSTELLSNDFIEIYHNAGLTEKCEGITNCFKIMQNGVDLYEAYNFRGLFRMAAAQGLVEREDRPLRIRTLELLDSYDLNLWNRSLIENTVYDAMEGHQYSKEELDGTVSLVRYFKQLKEREQRKSKYSSE